MVPPGLLFGGSLYKPEQKLGIGDRVQRKETEYTRKAQELGWRYVNQYGTIVHIATNPDHPYGKKNYLIEWIDEEQTFHGYADPATLIKFQKQLIVTGPGELRPTI